MDCLDHEKSTIYWIEDEIDSLEKMYLKHELIPEDAILFRLGEQPKYIIRSDLLEILNNKSFTGISVKSMGELLD